MNVALPKIIGSEVMSQCFSLSASNGERVGVRCRKSVGFNGATDRRRARQPGVFGDGDQFRLNFVPTGGPE